MSQDFFLLQVTGGLAGGVKQQACVSCIGSAGPHCKAGATDGRALLSALLSLMCRLLSSCLGVMVAGGLLYFWGPRQCLGEGKGREGNGAGATASLRVFAFLFTKDALCRDFTEPRQLGKLRNGSILSSVN